MAERAWRAVAAVAGLTDDGRWVQSWEWRTDLPLGLTAHHDDHIPTGRVDAFAKHGRVVMASGVFLDTPDGIEHAGLLESGALRWMSVEFTGDWEFLCTRYEDQGFGPECVEGFQVFEQATIVKVSQVGAGAFEASVMELVPDGEAAFDTGAVSRMVTEAESRIPPEPVLPAVVAHAWAAPSELAPPLEPPLAWFERPEPDEWVPLHIEPDGSVYGHVALDGTCHLGYEVCVTPPESPSGYGYFNLGRVVTRDEHGAAVLVRCGQVTMTTGHEADGYASVNETIAHYDNTGTAVADVVVSAGKFGPWACGAARSTITPEQVREFNGAKPSGDWRPIPGTRDRDLVAVLLVNVPGFPVLAAAGRRDEQGHSTDLGLVIGLPSYREWEKSKPRHDLDSLRADVDQVKAVVASLVEMYGEAVLDGLVASVG